MTSAVLNNSNNDSVSFSLWEKVAHQRRMRATRPTILTIAES
jgi:hypothetical protein